MLLLLCCSHLFTISLVILVLKMHYILQRTATHSSQREESRKKVEKKKKSKSNVCCVAKRSMKTKQSPNCVSKCTSPVYHVFQPLPLFFILFQLLPPRLLFLHPHSLEEPSLAHGFGLRRGNRHVRCLQSGLR